MGQKIFFRNGKPYLAFQDNTPYLYVSGSTPPAITGLPFAMTGWSYDGGDFEAFGSFGGFYNAAQSQWSCFDQTLPYTFTWSSVNPNSYESGAYASDLFAIWHVNAQPDPVMTDTLDPLTNLPFQSGCNGQYIMRHHPHVTGEYFECKVKCEAFKPDYINGTGDTFVAKRTYESGSSFYDCLNIRSIEFSSGNYPKIEFATATDANDFATSVDKWGIIGATGTIPNFAYTPYHYSLLDNKHYNVTFSVSGNYAYSSGLFNPNDTGVSHISKETNLMADLEARGLNNDWMYINLDMIDAFEDPECISGPDSSIANPMIVRRWDLENIFGQTYTHYSATSPTTYVCLERSFVIKGINEIGQGPWMRDEDMNRSYLSTWKVGYSKTDNADAGIDRSGIIFYQSASPATSSPWLDPITGFTWTLLSATGIVWTTGGDQAYTAWNGPGEIQGTAPNGWHYVKEVTEEWRVSGPSGDGFVYTGLGTCAYPYTYLGE